MWDSCSRLFLVQGLRMKVGLEVAWYRRCGTDSGLEFANAV